MNMHKEVPCQIWSRVCGFFRPLENFNIGKKEEYSERKPYNPKKLSDILTTKTT